MIALWVIVAFALGLAVGMILLHAVDLWTDRHTSGEGTDYR